MLVVFCVLLCACALALGQQRLDLYEGDICKQVSGSLWTCKYIRDCPKAQQDLKKGRRPQICNFVGTDPIVCCDPDVKPPQAVGAKAKAMCKEYAESVYSKIEDPGSDDIIKVDNCAVVEPLVTNGKDAESREYPHMALIGYGNKGSIRWLCGGSLISERFVLSAAHCTDAGARGMASWVRVGDYNKDSTQDDEMGMARSAEYEIIERFDHPQYKSPQVYNDLALYKLKTEVEFNEFVRPICLQTEHQFAKTYAIATGWGRIEWGGRPSDILQKGNVTIVSRKECSDGYQKYIGERLPNGIMDASQLCAGDIINRVDTCQGDSGGPLQLRLKEPYCMYSQVGVTSFGAGCGANVPGVYTRISHFVPWIEGIVWP